MMTGPGMTYYTNGFGADNVHAKANGGEANIDLFCQSAAACVILVG